jgi:hypothetical protein
MEATGIAVNLLISSIHQSDNLYCIGTKGDPVSFDRGVLKRLAGLFESIHSGPSKDDLMFANMFKPLFQLIS